MAVNLPENGVGPDPHFYNRAISHRPARLSGDFWRYPDRKPAPSGGVAAIWVGEVTLKMSKLRRQPFETVLIERNRRRESSIEESLIEMYPPGVSGRRIKVFTEALLGHLGIVRHAFEAQPEGPQAYRGMAQPADRGGVPLRLPRTVWRSSAAGPARCVMPRCWLRSGSVPMATGVSSVGLRATKRTERLEPLPGPSERTRPRGRAAGDVR